MDSILQMKFSSAFLWQKMLAFRSKFYWSLFLKVQLMLSQHYLGNGFLLNRHQAITWTNDDHINRPDGVNDTIWCHSASMYQVTKISRKQFFISLTSFSFSLQWPSECEQYLGQWVPRRYPPHLQSQWRRWHQSAGAVPPLWTGGHPAAGPQHHRGTGTRVVILKKKEERNSFNKLIGPWEMWL